LEQHRTLRQINLYYTIFGWKEIQYLKSYDPDRLLAGFRENKGLAPKADKYPGWENTEIRGHMLGHYLAALAQAYQSTKDDEIGLRLKYIVSELAHCQLESGYLSAFLYPISSPGFRESP
jgi:uncharacterized protein